MEFNGQNDQSLLNQIGAQVAGEGYDAVIPIATPGGAMHGQCHRGPKHPHHLRRHQRPATAGLTGIDRVTGTSDALNTAFILEMMFAQDPDIQTVGLPYSPGAEFRDAHCRGQGIPGCQGNRLCGAYRCQPG
ncbi:MAG: hypothetical protein ACLSAF_20035 [Intestinimonas sp.]